tara:strand:+ start:362 stop:850 length:489 start_codon:yes stop_codon:yes gene_type:complete
MEEFKDVIGCEGMYQISNLGRVKSLARKGCRKDRTLKPNTDAAGYFKVVLRKNSKSYCRTVHQLVAEAFLNHTPCGYKLVVNHINHDKQDNRPENLEIVSNRENTNRKHLRSSSKYTGVSWQKSANKWRVMIKFKGKQRYLGLFTDELEASEAYQTALKRIT